MEKYKSKFLSIEYFDAEKLTVMTWFRETETMSEKEFKQELFAYLEIVRKFSPNCLLSDTRNMFFPTDPELQEWTNKNIFSPCLELGVKKVAYVMSTDIIAQLSIEQVMGESFGAKFSSKFFDNMEEAKDWLRTNAKF